MPSIREEEFKIIIGLLSGLITWGGWKVIWPFLKRFSIWIKENFERPKILLNMMSLFQVQLEEIKADVKLIKYENQDNDGGSMKDGQNSIRTTLSVMVAANRMKEKGAVYESRLINGVMKAVYVSPYWTKLTGQSFADTESGGWLRCVSENDQDRVRKISQDAVDNGVLFQATYILVNCVYGNIYKVCCEVEPIKNSKGITVAWLGTMHVLEELPSLVKVNQYDTPTS